VSSDERKRVYVALYQNHLPQLDDVGLIEYDQSRGRVAAGPALQQASKYLGLTAAADAVDVARADGATQGRRRAASSASTSLPDGSDDAAGRVARLQESVDVDGSVSLGAGDAVAAVSVMALVGVWAGVVAPSVALAAVVAVAALAFVFCVTLAYR